MMRLFLIAALFCASATKLHGVSFGLLPEAGLMQQPASQYYLFIRGASAFVATEEQRFFTQVRYLARPVYDHQGFRETESGFFGLVGTKLDILEKSAFSLTGAFGYGQMQGSIEKNSERVGYRMPGLALDLSFSYRWSILHASLSHMTLLGYADAFQTEKRVLWPFQFFIASVGVAL